MSRTRRRRAYSRRGHDYATRRPVIRTAPDWPPIEPDDRDPVASWHPEDDPAPDEPLDDWLAEVEREAGLQ